MNYIKKTTNNQDVNEKKSNYLKIPAYSLGNFTNTDTTIKKILQIMTISVLMDI